jgi:hypothetical protein
VVTWDTDPVDGNWENSNNWTPATLPAYLAAFGASEITDITLPHGYDLTDLMFNSGASSFTFELEYDYDDYFAFAKNGVKNNSGVTQYFNVNSLFQCRWHLQLPFSKPEERDEERPGRRDRSQSGSGLNSKSAPLGRVHSAGRG